MLTNLLNTMQLFISHKGRVSNERHIEIESEVEKKFRESGKIKISNQYNL